MLTALDVLAAKYLDCKKKKRKVIVMKTLTWGGGGGGADSDNDELSNSDWEYKIMKKSHGAEFMDVAAGWYTF